MKKLLLLTAVILQSVLALSQQNKSLTTTEKEAILYMREEEKLARDIYDSLYSKWDINPFGNVRLSEQVHMDKMKTLIDANHLKDPVDQSKDSPGIFINTTMQQYYDELISSGSKSLPDALRVGAKIEELDILDLDKRIKQAKAKNVIAAFDLLKMGSENHLRAFVRRLKMQGINYEPVILEKKVFDKIITSGNQCKHGRNNCGQ